jgi:TolB-like protein
VLPESAGNILNQPPSGISHAGSAFPSQFVLAQIDRIVASQPFAHSPQLCRFLRFIVEQEIKGQGDQLKEYTLGVEVFRKDAKFDPRLDTVVRTEARRLRNKLNEYYLTAGPSDSIEIELPKGGYRPTFRARGGVVSSSPKPFALSRTVKALLVGTLALAVACAAVYWVSIRYTRDAHVPSVAVLPLENLSPDAEQEYFSDGMTDELITDLAKLRGLRVISRTSVLEFKRVKKPLREIAQKLGVDYVVEGTISRAGARMRITAQLIAASNERHLWAESYERDRGDALMLRTMLPKPSPDRSVFISLPRSRSG